MVAFIPRGTTQPGYLAVFVVYRKINGLWKLLQGKQ